MEQSLEGEEEMTSIELKPGDRVRLNELGASRSPKIKVRTGAVVALSSRKSRIIAVCVLFDGNKRPTRVHTPTSRSTIGRRNTNEIRVPAGRAWVKNQEVSAWIPGVDMAKQRISSVDLGWLRI